LIPDTHAHLDLIEQETGKVVRAAEGAGVSPIITIGINLASSVEAVRHSETFDSVYAAVGIHPNDTNDLTTGDIDRLEEIASSGGKVVAIGETGLDYYRDRSPAVRQKEAFRAQVRLARRLGLALIVHDRQAHDDTLDILKEEKADETRVVMHCFSGDADMLAEVSRRGYFVSFAGPVTFKKSQAVRKVAALVPPDRLLAETDSPFLSPEPYRGKPNIPERVRLVANELARIRGVTSDEMADLLTANTEKAFAISIREKRS
jgi:TatD DNase family protein